MSLRICNVYIACLVRMARYCSLSTSYSFAKARDKRLLHSASFTPVLNLLFELATEICSSDSDALFPCGSHLYRLSVKKLINLRKNTHNEETVPPERGEAKGYRKRYKVPQLVLVLAGNSPVLQTLQQHHLLLIVAILCPGRRFHALAYIIR